MQGIKSQSITHDNLIVNCQKGLPLIASLTSLLLFGSAI